MTELEKANEYIKKEMKNANDRYRPKYHFTPIVGWMNDPNGFVFYKDNYHIFYQYNPYDIKWGPMHWGHAISKDLLHWKREDVALCPDKNYDNYQGCFSGSAIEKDGKLYIMYTGVSLGKQTQNIALLDDDGKLIKYSGNPVIGEHNLPSGYDINDFRDPDVIKIGNVYYAIVGCKRKDKSSSLLLFKSEDLFKWNYINDVFTQKLYNDGMMECPNIIQIDGYDVVIYSPQYQYKEAEKAHKNIHSVMYLVGKMNYELGLFERMSAPRELDLGFDFYATQVTKNYDGTPLLIAWANMWDRSYPSSKDGWVGALSLPRILSIKNGKLIQKPIDTSSIIKEIYDYDVNEVSTIINENSSFELMIEIDANLINQFSICFAKDGDEETRLSYFKKDDTFIFDRSSSGQEIRNNDDSLSSIRSAKRMSSNETLSLRIIVDVSTIEIFIDDGDITFTGTIYKNKPHYDVEFKSDELKAFKKVKLKIYK